MIYLEFVRDAYFASESDGIVEVCAQLTNIMEPTLDEVWVIFSTCDGDALGEYSYHKDFVLDKKLRRHLLDTSTFHVEDRAKVS